MGLQQDLSCSLLDSFPLRRYNAPEQGYVGPKTACTETYGLVPETANGIHYDWNNTGRTYRCESASRSVSAQSVNDMTLHLGAPNLRLRTERDMLFLLGLTPLTAPTIAAMANIRLGLPGKHATWHLRPAPEGKLLLSCSRWRAL
jgi:hypothetical protein